MKEDDYFDANEHPVKSMNHYINDHFASMVTKELDIDIIRNLLRTALDQPDYVYDADSIKNDFFKRLNIVMDNNDVTGLQTISKTAHRGSSGDDMLWNTLIFSMNKECQVKLEVSFDMTSDNMILENVKVYMDKYKDEAFSEHDLLKTDKKCYQYLLMRAEDYLGRALPDVFYNALNTYFT